MTSTLDPDTSTAPRYAETLAEALPDDAKIAAVRAELEAAGVKYLLSCWIDLFGVPKTKPVPMSDFEALCKGKGPQFAVHSVSFVPELTAADSDQIPVPDLDAVYICPWDTSTAIIFADPFWEDKPYNVARGRPSNAPFMKRRNRVTPDTPASSPSSS